MDKEYRAFLIKDLFDIKPGKRLVADDTIPGDRPFIGALDNSNGVARFVNNTNVSLDKNVLGVNYNGNGMAIGFYHPYECIFSDDVKRFHLKDADDGSDVLLYVKVPIQYQKAKFGYLYKFNAKRMENTRIMLPVTDDGNPDWEYMEQQVHSKRTGLLVRYKEYVQRQIAKLEYRDIPSMDEIEWGRFHIGSLFTVKRPKARNKDDYESGDIPFVASGAMNNGIMKCCLPKGNESLDKGGCITVSPVDGSSFYQPIDFLGRGGAGSSILMLYNNVVNAYSGHFIARMISQTCSKYTYGHMGNKDSIKREIVMLPLTSSGEPDWAYMEQYAKNLMKRKYEQYLAYLDGQVV